MYVTGAGAGRYARVAIYNDAEELLGESASEEITEDGWHTFSMPSVSLLNAYYKLAAQLSDAAMYLWYDPVGTASYRDWTYGPFPGQLNPSGTVTREYSIYATYVTGVVYIDVSDAGAGVDSASLDASLTIIDTSIGLDELTIATHALTKPQEKVLAQINSYSRTKEDMELLCRRIGADGVVVVLGNEKDVANNRTFLSYFKSKGYYVVLMAELMMSENEYGRGNPNLWHNPPIAEIPEQYRAAGYPNGYTSVHPEEGLHQIRKTRTVATSSEHDQKLTFDYDWGMGVSTWDIGFGPSKVYDGRNYNFVWDHSDADKDILYVDQVGPGETSWEYVKVGEEDHIKIHNAVVGHEYWLWIMDRNRYVIVPNTQGAKDAYLKYLEYLMDSYGDLIDGFYSTNSAFPRECIVNPFVQDKQNSLYGPTGAFNLHEMTPPWHNNDGVPYKSYEGWAPAGTPNYNNYSWYRTVRDILKDLYADLANLLDLYGNVFGSSSSDQNQWAFTLCNEVNGDFADKWANGGWTDTFVCPANLETTAIPSYCPRAQNQTILEWGNDLIAFLEKSWRYRYNGTVLWWLSTIPNYDPTEQEIADMRTISDKFKQKWNEISLKTPLLTVSVVQRGAGTGKECWSPIFDRTIQPDFVYLPIKFLDIGQLPLIYELANSFPTCDLVYSYLLEDSGRSALSTAYENWINGGKGFMALGIDFDLIYFHISPYDDYDSRNTAFNITDVLRTEYSNYLKILLPSIINFISAIRGLRSPNDEEPDPSLLKLLYRAYLNPRVGVHLLSHQPDKPGKIVYFSVDNLSKFQNQAFARIFLHKLLFWTGNKANNNEITINSDKTKIMVGEIVTITGILRTEDGIPIPSEDVVLIVDNEDKETKTCGLDGSYSFSLSFQNPGIYSVKTQAQRWAGTVTSQIITITVEEFTAWIQVADSGVGADSILVTILRPHVPFYLPMKLKVRGKAE